MPCSSRCHLWSPSPLHVHETLAVQRGNAKKAKEFNDPMDPVNLPCLTPAPPPPFRRLW